MGEPKSYGMGQTWVEVCLELKKRGARDWSDFWFKIWGRVPS